MPAMMPQTVYYPMPNSMMPQAARPAVLMPPAMPASVQRAAADMAAPGGPMAGAAPMPAAAAPVFVQRPVMQESVMPGPGMTFPLPQSPPGYARMPASVDAADNVNDDAPPRYGWMLGGTAYLLKPYSNDNLAFTTDRATTTRSLGSTTTSNVRSAEDFSYDLSISPEGWIGYLGPQGLGFRADYFRFDQRAVPLATTLTGAEASGTAGTTTTTLSIAPPTAITSALPLGGFIVSAPTAVTAIAAAGTGLDTLSFASRLQIESIDLEAACDLQLGRCWSLLFTGGARYLRVAQDYVESVSASGVPPGAATAATEMQALGFGHTFTGVGPTLAVQARWARPNGNLAFFGSARGALLVGRTGQSFFFTDVITDSTGVLGNSSFSSEFNDRRDQVVPVAELEVGLEYAVCLTHVRPFLRAAAINQTYFGVGNASRTDTNLGLFGADFSLGVNY
jgi:hypothetical protein